MITFFLIFIKSDQNLLNSISKKLEILEKISINSNFYKPYPFQFQNSYLISIQSKTYNRNFPYIINFFFFFFKNY